MAAIDYGAIIRVNRKYVNTGNFPAIRDIIPGIKDAYVKDPKGLISQRRPPVKKGIFSADGYNYLGTKDFYLSLNRYICFVVKDKEVVDVIGLGDDEWGLPYQKQALHVNVEGVDISIKRLDAGSNRYYIHFILEGIPYEGIYGYGVDSRLNVWYELTPKEERKARLFMGMED